MLMAIESVKQERVVTFLTKIASFSVYKYIQYMYFHPQDSGISNLWCKHVNDVCLQNCFIWNLWLNLNSLIPWGWILTFYPSSVIIASAFFWLLLFFLLGLFRIPPQIMSKYLVSNNISFLMSYLCTHLRKVLWFSSALVIIGNVHGFFLCKNIVVCLHTSIVTMLLGWISSPFWSFSRLRLGRNIVSGIGG